MLVECVDRVGMPTNDIINRHHAHGYFEGHPIGVQGLAQGP